MTTNNTIIEENEPVVATQETQDSITNKLHKIGPVANKKEMKEICQGFKKEGGSFEEYRRWTVRIMAAKWSKKAYGHWRKATGDYDMSTLESYAQRYTWKTKK